MRKSFFTLALVLVLAISGHAQMQKGTWLLDGQAGSTHNKIEENRATLAGGSYYTWHRTANFYLQPGVGYFVKENWALGISGDFQFLSGETRNLDGSEAGKGNYRGYGLGFFTRKYVSVSEKLAFYGDLRVGGYLGKPTSMDVDSGERIVHTKRKGLSGSAAVGLQYLVAGFLGIHLQSSLIDYDYHRSIPENYEGDNTTSNLNAGLFSSYQIGATFFF
ncbi:hypothetical protein J0A67_14810 [Algoriphagus aestuariicola]|uniref:Outer membrane protein beta-barrel domain-containing protein n=1 Tax=Algoriphagus aestuariicola TaxID=1852016 RepID=A0ABS3BS82_9BACT|nr:hypothetical protein [Algoriphagus aestuariicola]MBN7802142.1 hypothetical protein [Algoriphagus aestuariicola]